MWKLADRFLPFLELMFQAVSSNNENPYQMDMMVLIMKIFNLMNYSSIAPCLFEPGKIRPWVEYIVQILDAQQGADSPLTKWTAD